MFENFKNSNETFIIAEVGQNHQGKLDEALRYIEVFSSLGADAIKFQMRFNSFLFTRAALDRSYDSENAFGPTYGEHRAALELSEEAWPIIKQKCQDCGVFFMCTPFDELSLNYQAELGTPILKVASFDLGNLPFLSKICDTEASIVVSTGGGQSDHIETTIRFLESRGADFCVLHCVSEYPTAADRLNLGMIKVLKERFPEIVVGLSDHFNGVLSGPISYMIGARVFEKHVTFNRANKGTDHSFALTPHGFENFVRDIKRVPVMSGAKQVDEPGKEYVFKKLGKSICAGKKIKKGDIFTLDNLSGIIHLEHGIPVRDSDKLLGKSASRGYEEREIIDVSDLD